MTYELFEHTADVGLRMRAADFEGLLIEGARALVSVIVSEPAAIQARETVGVRVEGQQREDLLVDWLSELLYLFESRGFLGCHFALTMDGGGLTAEVRGEVYDRQRHGKGTEVKAITYHALRVEQNAEGWLAEVIVDL